MSFKQPYGARIRPIDHEIDTRRRINHDRERRTKRRSVVGGGARVMNQVRLIGSVRVNVSYPCVDARLTVTKEPELATGRRGRGKCVGYQQQPGERKETAEDKSASR